ncbi:MAG: hypothetical protein J5I59_13475 [Saprospiraceae bacterium]|nr:hypothetical protein [Saprospiraceae bacterium]
MKKYFYFLLVSALFVSCTKDDPQVEPGRFDNGVFVVNEGPFSSGTGTLTFIGDNDTITQMAFQKVNNTLLGNIAQSMIYHEGRYFIVVNNANKVIVTDKDLKNIGEIKGVHGPRYIAAKGNKAYISEWGENYSNGAIAVVDLNTLSVTSKIPTGNGPEYLLIDGNKLFVPNGGSYDATTFASLPDSTISVIDLDQEKVINTIAVKYNPNSIAKVTNGYLVSSAEKEYLAGNGNISFVKQTDFSVTTVAGVTPGNYSKIRRIDNQHAIVLTNFAEANVLNFEPATTSVTTTSLGAAYSMDYDPKRNLIYVGDAKDFSAAGEVKTFKIDGSAGKTYAAGIIPTNFCFR